MSAELLTNLSAALSQVFDAKLAKQWNRLAVTASVIEAKPGRGKNAAWDVEFTGATAATVAEGADVQSSEFAQDVNTDAILNWAHYRSSFALSETEADAAASSMGSPEEIMQIFEDRLEGSAAKLAEAINIDLISGTGTDGSGNPTIIGLLQGPLEISGTYAGINRASFAEWKGNVLSNSAVARPLSFDLLYKMEQNIYTASGERPDCLITTPAVYRKYAGLFEAARRVVSDGLGPVQYGEGASNLFWTGYPVLRDRKMTAGVLTMLTRKNVEAKYLPRRMTPQDAVSASMKMLDSSNGGDGVRTITGIPGRVALLAKTGDSVKVSVKTTLQMCVKRPNANGYISDIDET